MVADGRSSRLYGNVKSDGRGLERKFQKKWTWDRPSLCVACPFRCSTLQANGTGSKMYLMSPLMVWQGGQATKGDGLSHKHLSAVPRFFDSVPQPVSCAFAGGAGAEALVREAAGAGGQLTVPGASAVDAQPRLAPALAARGLSLTHVLQAAGAYRVAGCRIRRGTVGTAALAYALFRSGEFHMLLSVKVIACRLSRSRRQDHRIALSPSFSWRSRSCRCSARRRSGRYRKS